MSISNFESLSFFEQKESEELKQANSVVAKRRRERIVFLGLFAIAMLSTLLFSGSMGFLKS